MLSIEPALMLLLLLVGHALADYSLQTEFMAVAKDRNTPEGAVFWPYVLTAHSLIHAGFVAVLTGSVWLGAGEFVIHWLVDRLKCERIISLRSDQAIHVLCKAAWWLLWWLVIPHA